MQVKVKTFNSDGSIAFDGVFDANEAQLVLEVGVNYLLSQGVLPFVEQDEDDDEDFIVEGSPTVQ